MLYSMTKLNNMRNNKAIPIYKLAYETPCLIAIDMDTVTERTAEAYVDGERKLVLLSKVVTAIIKLNKENKYTFIFVHAKDGVYSQRPAIEYFRLHALYDVLSESEFLDKCRSYGVDTTPLSASLV